jgi:hypothetical protein
MILAMSDAYALTEAGAMLPISKKKDAYALSSTFVLLFRRY